MTTSQHLRWNIDDFKIDYACEWQEIKIWKYYLRRLVVDENDTTDLPHLHKDFDKRDAKKLWDHLIEVFIPESTNKENLERR